MNEPECPNGHGPMRQKSLAGKAEVELATHEVIDLFEEASYTCEECGTRVERRATRHDRELEVCDFCSGPDPVITYRCRDFHTVVIGVDDKGQIHEQPWSSFGDWAACEPCARFIDADDQPGLTTYAVEGHMARNEPDAQKKRADLVESMGQLHRLFFMHRTVTE